jgi:probable phosphoglycerate mutase
VSFDERLPPEGFRQRGAAPTGTRLLMIRHGESVANETGLAGGPLGDGGLTARGRAQAPALAARLSMTGELSAASALYTSTLPRAIETGAIVLPAVGVKLTAVADESLGELGVGEADGLTWEEIADRYVAPDWNADPFARNVPGGESLIEFFDRCVGAIDRLVVRHPRALVVLVVHGGFIEQALKIYQGLSGEVRLRPRIEFCSMSEFEFDGERRRLLRYNDLSPMGAA